MQQVRWKMINTLLKTILLLFLAAASFIDHKEKKIPVILVSAGFAAGLVLRAVAADLMAYEIAGGCMLGLGFLLIAKLTNESVGYGDGMMLTATGAFLGLKDNIFLLLYAMLAAAVISVILMIVKKKKKSFRIAFIPFMLAGYIVVLAV